MASEGSGPTEYEVHDPGLVDAPSRRVLHAKSFKLLFAAQREPGRSYLSAVKPLALPATVTGKFYSPEPSGNKEMEEATQRAFDKIERMFNCGPRERHNAPVTSAQEYGWYWSSNLSAVGRVDRRLQRPIADSPWMKERLRVLAADTRLKQR